jgi:hypothetical protein
LDTVTRMPDPIVAAESFSERYGNDVKAALIRARHGRPRVDVVDRTAEGPRAGVVAAVSGGELSPGRSTRGLRSCAASSARRSS